jgi:pSer/pThr/pTyr-binding forkhead associated (FHA) protein
MRLRITAPDGKTSERVVAAVVVGLGRDPACEVPFDPAVYPTVSGRHASIEQTPAGLVLTPLSRSNKTLLNDQPVERPAAIKVGDRVRLGFTGPTIEVLAGEAARPQPARRVSPAATPAQVQQASDSSATAQAQPAHLALLRGSLGT